VCYISFYAQDEANFSFGFTLSGVSEGFTLRIRQLTETKGGDYYMAQMYCVKCRAKRDDPNATKVTMKNGKPAMKGKCPVCGTGMYKIGG